MRPDAGLLADLLTHPSVLGWRAVEHAIGAGASQKRGLLVVLFITLTPSFASFEVMGEVSCAEVVESPGAGEVLVRPDVG